MQPLGRRDHPAMDALSQPIERPRPTSVPTFLCQLPAPPTSPEGHDNLFRNVFHAKVWRVPGTTRLVKIGDFLLIKGNQCLAHCFWRLVWQRAIVLQPMLDRLF
jgi:hypothetical protein